MAARDQPNQLPAGLNSTADVPVGFARQQLDEVKHIKANANEKFREGDFFSAKCLYSGALELLERCCLHVNEADETWEGLKNNMALCDLKRQEWTRVVEATNEILARNAKNSKALYRRGAAKVGQGKLVDAQQDFRTLLDFDPNNADAKARLAEIQTQMRENRAQMKEQNEKMRGFLQGERLDESVSISEDGGIRKIHSNDNAPLLAPWFKREWVVEGSGVVAAVTCHVVMKTQAGKEVFTTRKPPGALQPNQVGPHMVNSTRPASRPIEPVRFVLDDAFGGAFKAWNAAVKTLRINEVGRFEVAKHTMGPSVEGAIKRCVDTWMRDSPANDKMYKDMSADIKAGYNRKTALGILCLPEDFCMEVVESSNESYLMEMELCSVDEVMDLDGDGRRLMQVLHEGRPRSADNIVTDLSTVKAHFRVAKLLMNYFVKDTRIGLVNGREGLSMEVDRTRDPLQFIVGEEDAVEDGEFAPPVIGQCLLSIPGGVVEGMQFELILRDGVPVSHMEKAVHKAYAEGKMDGMPDTTGPVVIRIEVDSVVQPCRGPSTQGWRGVQSMRDERRRAEELEQFDGGRYKLQALKRWRRVIVWLEQVLEGRRWKLQDTKAAGADSMYDLAWEDDDETPESAGEASKAAKAVEAVTEASAEPSMLEPEAELVKQLSDCERAEWGAAHAAAARLLMPTEPLLAQRHAACGVQAAEVGAVPKDTECSARSSLATALLEQGKTAEALECLKVAQTLDPSSDALKDQVARILQKDTDRITVDVKGALKNMKVDIVRCINSGDMSSLLMLLGEIDGMPLTWEAVSETAIGKEVGQCAKLSDEGVSTQAKSIIGKLHKLAKHQRPMWVR